MIAEEIKDKITTDEYIERIEEKSGYLNFYINNEISRRSIKRD